MMEIKVSKEVRLSILNKKLCVMGMAEITVTAEYPYNLITNKILENFYKKAKSTCTFHKTEDIIELEYSIEVGHSNNIEQEVKAAVEEVNKVLDEDVEHIKSELEKINEIASIELSKLIDKLNEKYKISENYKLILP